MYLLESVLIFCFRFVILKFVFLIFVVFLVFCRDSLFNIISIWIGFIFLGLGWVLLVKKLLVGYSVGSRYLVCGLELVIVMVLGCIDYVCLRYFDYSVGVSG